MHPHFSQQTCWPLICFGSALWRHLHNSSNSLRSQDPAKPPVVRRGVGARFLSPSPESESGFGAAGGCTWGDPARASVLSTGRWLERYEMLGILDDLPDDLKRYVYS
jgi:hypothetical protein